MTLIFKILSRELWARLECEGAFKGSPADLGDGFIHFSTAAQLAGTAAKHFRGEKDLVLVAVETAKLPTPVKWEPARGGELFPHLYGILPLSAVLWARPLPADSAGRHQFEDVL